jgi:hypothetical protein
MDDWMAALLAVELVAEMAGPWDSWAVNLAVWMAALKAGLRAYERAVLWADEKVVSRAAS